MERGGTLFAIGVNTQRLLSPAVYEAILLHYSMLTNLFAEPRVYLLVKLHVLRVGPVYEAILYIPPSSRIIRWATCC